VSSRSDSQFIDRIKTVRFKTGGNILNEVARFLKTFESFKEASPRKFEVKNDR